MIRAKTAELDGSTIKLDALPDPADFRDRLFEPTLVEVPVRVDLEEWQRLGVPVHNQGPEGSCTGFALMTVAHYLLRTRAIDPDPADVSPRMFYEMAKRYDEWPGESYEGSSARGAMKGWHKHGVCAESLWSYESGAVDRDLTETRANDALSRPLGSYYRVNHKDLVAMHNAIAEAGVLFVTSVIHRGWLLPSADGIILPHLQLMGGHAYVIVGYNADGFWIQNSWGKDWGRGGCALLTYDDWLAHGMDVWVARLGVPVRLRTVRGTANALAEDVRNAQAQPLDNVRRFVIRTNVDGKLMPNGTYATSEHDVARLFDSFIPEATADWSRKRLMLFAPTGMESEKDAVHKAVEFGTKLAGDEIYPIVFVWRTDFWSAIEKILQEALSRRRPDDAHLDRRNEFMIERLDSALEPLSRALSGRLLWEENKEVGVNAMRNREAGGRIFLDHLQRYLRDNPDAELHLVAHGAGSNFFTPMVQMLTTPAECKIEDGPMKGRTGLGFPLTTCTLWAPANTIAEFNIIYRRAMVNGDIKRLSLYTLSEQAERKDHCAHIYYKSFLYLVAHALEQDLCIPFLCPQGTPLVGLEEHVSNDPALFDFFSQGPGEWVISPNSYRSEDVHSAGATSHRAFDSDTATLLSTVARIKDVY
jgi:hypothetical protein